MFLRWEKLEIREAVFWPDHAQPPEHSRQEEAKHAKRHVSVLLVSLCFSEFHDNSLDNYSPLFEFACATEELFDLLER